MEKAKNYEEYMSGDKIVLKNPEGTKEVYKRLGVISAKLSKKGSIYIGGYVKFDGEETYHNFTVMTNDYRKTHKDAAYALYQDKQRIGSIYANQSNYRGNITINGLSYSCIFKGNPDCVLPGATGILWGVFLLTQKTNAAGESMPVSRQYTGTSQSAGE
jgi:hypothetical protein